MRYNVAKQMYDISLEQFDEKLAARRRMNMGELEREADKFIAKMMDG